MQISLRSEEIGAIRLHTVLRDDLVHATIGVERAELAGTLRAGLPALEQSLATQNLRVHTLDVYQTHSQSATPQGSADSSSHHHPQHSGAQAGTCSPAEQPSSAWHQRELGETLGEEFSPGFNPRLSVRV
jgi:hypothetical protein